MRMYLYAQEHQQATTTSSLPRECSNLACAMWTNAKFWLCALATLKLASASLTSWILIKRYKNKFLQNVQIWGFFIQFQETLRSITFLYNVINGNKNNIFPSYSNCLLKILSILFKRGNRKRENFDYLRFKFCKSDQHPGIALILTVFSQWHIGENSGIKVSESSEVVMIQVRVPFLLQVHQIWETWFRWVWANDLVNIVRVICNKNKVLWLDEGQTNGVDTDVYGSYNHRTHGIQLPSLRNFLILLSFWWSMASCCFLSVCSSSSIWNLEQVNTRCGLDKYVSTHAWLCKPKHQKPVKTTRI